MGILDSLKAFFDSGKLDVSSRFALQRRAISGTMGKFYLARDMKADKLVGLKILDPKKTAFFEARFKGLDKPTEGQIAVQFDHPHVVRTFEHGLTTKNEQYLVMEFIDGPDMNSVLIAKDPVLDGQRLKLIRQAAEAIGAVHEKGFIHRDICPRNLLLCRTRDEVKLIDFGLAVPATKAFMQPGNRTGTPNYMAPEIVRRRATSPRVDIFAFGVSAYEILTYELPWLRGSTGMAAMTHDQPAKDIRAYRPKIDSTLADAIHWCLKPEAKDRCPTMEDFLHAIRKVEHEDR
jgi:serine/threonine-protein kinase